MTAVTLVPLNADSPTYGPYYCRRFSMTGSNFTAELEDGMVLNQPLNGIYACIAEPEDGDPRLWPSTILKEIHDLCSLVVHKMHLRPDDPYQHGRIDGRMQALGEVLAIASRDEADLMFKDGILGDHQDA